MKNQNGREHFIETCR